MVSGQRRGRTLSRSRNDRTPPATVPPLDGARTPLGRKLRAIRARIVASGEPFLNWDDLEKEMASRRGGLGVSALPPTPSIEGKGYAASGPPSRVGSPSL